MPLNIFTRFRKEIWLITVTELLITTSVSICLPFFSLYLYQDRGIPMTLVGTIILVSGLSAAAAMVLGGELSDRFGRRIFLIYTSVIRIIMFVGMALLIGSSAPVWIIALVYIVGQSIGSIKHPIIFAAIADLAPQDLLTETYGFLRIGKNVGWAAGPAIGGYMAGFLPYSWLFGFAALVAAVVFGLILVFFPESSNKAVERVSFGKSISTVSGDWKFISFCILCLFVFLVMGQMVSTLSVFTVDHLGFSTEQYGLLLTMNGVIVILFQYPVARKIAGMAKPTALILGCILYGLGYLSLGWTGSFIFALIAMTIITAGEIIFSPVTTSLAAELSPEERRGYYMGFMGFAERAGIAFGPLVGGVLLDNFRDEPRFTWGIIAAIGFASAAGFHLWRTYIYPSKSLYVEHHKGS